MGLFKMVALLAAVALSTESGREYLKKLVKSILRTGYLAKESADDFAAKTKEYKDEILAEIKVECQDKEHEKNGAKKAKVASNEG